MISIDNVSVSFGGTPLFTDISVLINPKDRIGLVGKNGAGKSTLLKILMGSESPTSGAVSSNGDCTMGYLPQQMNVADTTTLIDETAKAFEAVNALEKQIEELTEQIASRDDYESEGYHKLIERLNHANDHFNILGGGNREADIEKTLLGLGFKREDFGRNTKEFSGGWRMRIELAKLLLKCPSLLLLDEPTNHLDIESIEWLENYIKDYNGAMVLISHDKAFLDNTTTRTVEISCGRVTDYKVSYSKYVELRKERREQQIAAFNNQQKTIQAAEEFIERFRYKPTKSNQVQSRIKQLEKIERLEIDDEDLSAINLKFPPSPRSGQVVAQAKDAAKSFGEKKIFEGANLVIERGEKVAFVGRNGEGKTTMARIILGEINATAGEVKTGHNVEVGYFAQNQDDLMDGEFTVFDTLDRIAVGDIRTRLRDILGAFLFRGQDIEKKVKVLSGGERSRLAMARLMLSPHNLLVLDEPTNHMDMRSKEMLKKAIKEFDGTAIIVSHDREFLDGLVDKVYEFRSGAVKEHLGGIYDFLRARRLENVSDIERRDEVKAKEPAKASSNKENYALRKEQEKQIRKVATQIERIEQSVEAKEAELEELGVRLAEPDKYNLDLRDGKLFAEYDALKKTIEELMNQWEELNHQIEELKK